MNKKTSKYHFQLGLCLKFEEFSRIFAAFPLNVKFCMTFKWIFCLDALYSVMQRYRELFWNSKDEIDLT